MVSRIVGKILESSFHNFFVLSKSEVCGDGNG